MKCVICGRGRVVGSMTKGTVHPMHMMCWGSISGLYPRVSHTNWPRSLRKKVGITWQAFSVQARRPAYNYPNLPLDVVPLIGHQP